MLTHAVLTSLKSTKHRWSEGSLAFIPLLALIALCLATYTTAYWPGDSWLLRFIYWFCRLGLALVFYTGAYYGLGRVPYFGTRPLWRCLLAILLSAVPLFLAVVSLDIVSQRPNAYALTHAFGQGQPLQALLFSLWFKITLTHLAFGLLVFTFDRRQPQGATEDTSNQPAHQTATTTSRPTPLACELLDKLPADQQGAILRLEAQEHYTHVTTTAGTALILYRFGQALSAVAALDGRQVHRSFWVADTNVQGWSVRNKKCVLILHHGESVPVSRRFEQEIKREYNPVDH